MFSQLFNNSAITAGIYPRLTGRERGREKEKEREEKKSTLSRVYADTGAVLSQSGAEERTRF